MRENTTEVMEKKDLSRDEGLIVSCKREFIKERIYYRCIPATRYLEQRRSETDTVVRQLSIRNFEARFERIGGMHALIVANASANKSNIAFKDHR